MAGVTTPYAGALFEMAIENGSLDAVYQEAFDVLNVFRKEPDFSEMLRNPRIPPEDKEAAILKALAGMDANLTGLIALMLKKGRGAYIEAALGEFAARVKEYRGIIGARVYSAAPLTAEQLSALQEQLTRKTGKQVEIETYVDPSLIGGLLIKIGGMALDSTIKKHLQTLRKHMA